MGEVEEIRWPLKEAYARLLGCKYWPWPLLKGWIPCRFPLLRMAGKAPCDLCHRKYIYEALLRVKGAK